jgi:hypothetical protein
VSARETTFERIDHAETEAEREALLAWADAEAQDFGIAPISLQYQNWIANDRRIEAN